MESFIIALDQGTSSCRALLVNIKGEIVAVEQQEFDQHFPKDGWVEHDPNEIWTVQMDMMDKLIQKNVKDISNIQCIGITNQRETTVIWNKHTGEPIYNAIVWQDTRTVDYCKILKEGGLEDYIFNNTGLQIDTYFSGTKVKWILDHCDIDPVDLCFGTIDTWLIWKMTKGEKHVTDYTNASRTMLFNIHSLKWDDKILAALDIQKSMLPKVQASASHFGTYNYRGLEIPITGVAGDQQAALFGQACFEKGMAKNTYGTGCFMLMHIGDEYVASNNGLLTTLACNSDGSVCYALEGSIFVAGAAVQWLRDGLKVIKNSSETETLSYEVQEDYGVVVVPAFAGLGAPYWNMESKGAIYGLTSRTGIAHLAKATLESMAYRTKDVLEAMVADSGISLEVLKVDGGACQNNYLMQFQSDILSTNVERPKNIESTSLGAAYLAGITLGLWDAQLVIQNRDIEKIFLPEMDSEKRTKLYQYWQACVKRTLVSEVE